MEFWTRKKNGVKSIHTNTPEKMKNEQNEKKIIREKNGIFIVHFESASQVLCMHATKCGPAGQFLLSFFSLPFHPFSQYSMIAYVR